MQELSKLPGIRVFPSEANYFMCELTGNITAAELTEHLLVKKQILIKDLTEKIKGKRQYIRIAVRDDADNQNLLDALREELKK